PTWLTFVRTGKARSAIRHHLRTINLAESIEQGQRLLGQALRDLDLPPEIPTELAERLLSESSAGSLDELYADVGVGKRIATLVARHVYGLMETDSANPPKFNAIGEPVSKLEPVQISGNEGAAVQLASCCQPIPGDRLLGQLRRNQG